MSQQYQVLARKYRPKNFHELVGQTHVSKALINAIDHNRLHHAYLFTGTRGVGKTTIARILSKCLNCETDITSTPCGVCSSCVAIDEGRFIDLIEIDAASRTKVEDTRELIDNVPYAPTQGRYKVYLIDEVHMLSTHSFNALLKTLEEPPEHVKFLLATTDPQKLPITIISRCLQFVLRPLPQQAISEHLANLLTQEGVSYTQPALWQLANAAKGSVRDALSLTDQAIAFGQGELTDETVNDMLGLIDSADLTRLILDIYQGNTADVAAHIEQMRAQMVDAGSMFDGLAELLHQIAMVQLLPNVSLNVNEIQAQQITQLAQHITPDVLQLYYQIVVQGREQIKLANTPLQALEMCLLRLLAFRPLATNEVAPNQIEGGASERASVNVNQSGQVTDDQDLAEQELEDQTEVEQTFEKQPFEVQPIVDQETVNQQIANTETVNPEVANPEAAVYAPNHLDNTTLDSFEDNEASVINNNVIHSKAVNTLQEIAVDAAPNSSDFQDGFVDTEINNEIKAAEYATSDNQAADFNSVEDVNLQERVNLAEDIQNLAEISLSESKTSVELSNSEYRTDAQEFSEPQQPSFADSSLEGVTTAASAVDPHAQPTSVTPVNNGSNTVTDTNQAVSPEVADTVLTNPEVTQATAQTEPEGQQKLSVSDPRQLLKTPRVALEGEWSADKWDYWLQSARDMGSLTLDQLALARQGVMTGEIRGKSEFKVAFDTKNLQSIFNHLAQHLAEQFGAEVSIAIDSSLEADPSALLPQNRQKQREIQAVESAKNMINASPVMQRLAHDFEGKIVNLKLLESD